MGVSWLGNIPTVINTVSKYIILEGRVITVNNTAMYI